MIEIIAVACIIMVDHGNKNYDHIVQTGTAIETYGDYWTIDFTKALKEGGFDLTLNRPSVRVVHSNDCLITAKKVNGKYESMDPNMGVD